ncbi:MAG: SRPBCC family protein [Gemmatimonadaceae bacterium]|nr:SRPBCC family protein [Gemmatimonadaceae bacterium]
MIRSHIEIDRTPTEVFAYVADLDRHCEWQDAIISARKVPAGPTRLGTHNFETRRLPGGPREVESEIYEYEPPRRIAAKGVNGPVRATIVISIEPLDGASRSRLTTELTLEGRGIGRLLLPLARRVARKQVPRDQLRLKHILESGQAVPASAPAAAE